MSCIGMLYCKGTSTLAVLILLYPCIHAKCCIKKKPDTSKQPLDVLLPICHTSKHSHYCNKMVAPPTSLLLLRHWWQSWMHFFNDSGKKFLVHNAKGPCLSWCTQRSTKSMCCCSKNRKKFLQLKLVLFQLKLLQIVSTASHLNEWCSYRLTKYGVTILSLMKLFTADLANYNGHFTFEVKHLFHLEM